MKKTLNLKEEKIQNLENIILQIEETKSTLGEEVKRKNNDLEISLDKLEKMSLNNNELSNKMENLMKDNRTIDELKNKLENLEKVKKHY